MKKTWLSVYFSYENQFSFDLSFSKFADQFWDQSSLFYQIIIN